MSQEGLVNAMTQKSLCGVFSLFCVHLLPLSTPFEDNGLFTLTSTSSDMSCKQDPPPKKKTDKLGI